MLASHQNQAARHAELLLDGHRRLADAQARYGTPLNNRFPEHLVAVISDHAQISDLSAALANTARQDWMTLENLATEMPLTDDFAAPPLPAARGMVRCRSIYPAAAMDDPVARRIIETCVQAGEQARLLPNAQGLADAAIARRAGISVTTVRRHITTIMAKLNVTSRFAAGAAAQRRGWIG